MPTKKSKRKEATFAEKLRASGIALRCPKPRVRWIARVGRRESVHTNAAAARKIAGTRGTVMRYVEVQP